ncbi:hypothetical protein N7470_005657 [Penicillium chermesinum]|nr:hypothetical protein N7470_005657 [Penicillium chermesinum]
MAEGGVKRSASPARAISPPPIRRKVGSTTNKKAIDSFFTPKSQKKPESITWRTIGTSLIIGRCVPSKPSTQPEKSKKIAGFDLDSTLIKTKSGNVFPKSSEDWKWWDNTVESRLKSLNSEGYQVVVFSNQKMVKIQKDIKAGKADSKSYENFTNKMTTIMRILDIPMSVYAATTDPKVRKPQLGMWREFIDDYDLDVSGIDLPNSFFVGDAAGRPGDHSAVDRGFASNAGLAFKTPEEFFQGKAQQVPTDLFDPADYIQPNDNESSVTKFARKHPLELVIFCGSPGAGKSTYYWKNIQPLGYERVNQDLLKTRPKCLKVAREHLEAKRSVAVDNTNADAETRLVWITLAKDLGVPIRCVHLLSPPVLCRHNNTVRAANKELNPESRASLPGIAFGDFKKRYKKPELSEGFDDIIDVEFRFQGTPGEEKVWRQHWI